VQALQDGAAGRVSTCKRYKMEVSSSTLVFLFVLRCRAREVVPLVLNAHLRKNPGPTVVTFLASIERTHHND